MNKHIIFNITETIYEILSLNLYIEIPLNKPLISLL